LCRDAVVSVTKRQEGEGTTAKPVSAAVEARRKKGPRIGWEVHRRLKWEDPDKMAAAIDAYFEETSPPHHDSGLALALGFSSRMSLYNYAKRPKFAEVMAHARLRLEASLLNYGFKDPKKAWFTDRALTRFGFPCIEQTKENQVVEHKIVLFGKPIAAGSDDDKSK